MHQVERLSEAKIGGRGAHLDVDMKHSALGRTGHDVRPGVYGTSLFLGGLPEVASTQRSVLMMGGGDVEAVRLTYSTAGYSRSDWP